MIKRWEYEAITNISNAFFFIVATYLYDSPTLPISEEALKDEIVFGAMNHHYDGSYVTCFGADPNWKTLGENFFRMWVDIAAETDENYIKLIEKMKETGN